MRAWVAVCALAVATTSASAIEIIDSSADKAPAKWRTAFLMLMSDQLRDPDTAKIRNLQRVAFTDGAATCGEVNAKNGFGGFTGFQPFILTFSFTDQRSEMGTPQKWGAERWSKAWEKICN